MAGTLPLGTRLMTVEIDGDSYTAEVSSVKLSAADSNSDFVTYADAAAGGSKDWTLQFTAGQDLSAESLQMKIISAAGTTVPVVLAPYGGTTPSETNPQIQFNAVIAAPDGDFIGGDANASAKARQTFSASWEIPGGIGSSNFITTTTP
jgi:hypothetical protein